MRSHALLLIGIILTGCGTFPVLIGEPPRPAAQPVHPADDRAVPLAPDEQGRSIAQAALALAEAEHRGRVIRLGNRRYPLDCSGTILAIHYAAGIDLLPAFSAETGNGVARLWKMGTETSPRKGDVVFWDNTYDRNRNGLWDDKLTHAGVIVDIDANGTISYVHHHYRLGIIVEQMNLERPEDRNLNSAMRMRGQTDPEGRGRWLASHLYRGARALH
ncbi:MAG: hypothetical protein EA427_14380 [Spirochaetaceae bacterium]|nr:MAG: hypothetical protein EA427_14380 [Spirochaetaceae bacterium]